MDYQNLIQSLTPDVIDRLRLALELGKWPDGRVLSDEQKAHCLDAVIHWEACHRSPEQRTGYIDRGRKQSGEQCSDTQIVRMPDGQERERGH